MLRALKIKKETDKTINFIFANKKYQITNFKFSLTYSATCVFITVSTLFDIMHFHQNMSKVNLQVQLRIAFYHFREQEWKAVVYISFTRNCRNWISHLVLGFGPITKDYPAPLNKSFPKGKSRTEQGIMRSVGISPQSRTFFLQIKTFEFSVLESNPNKPPKNPNA